MHVPPRNGRKERHGLRGWMCGSLESRHALLMGEDAECQPLRSRRELREYRWS
jgi:hypothetical protein